MSKTDEDWFQEIKEREERMRANKEGKQENVFWFYLKPGEEKKIIFLDSGMGTWFNVYEIWKDNKVYRFRKDDSKPCPIEDQYRDDKGRKPYSKSIRGYTIINTTPYTKRDGSVVKGTKMFYGAYGPALEMLEKLRLKHGSLANLVINVKRIGDKDKMGNYFEVLGKISSEKIVANYGEGFDVPFDYGKILPFPTAEDLAKIGVKVNTGGTQNDLKELEEDLDFEPVETDTPKELSTFEEF